MNFPTSEILIGLQKLLPGFLAAAVFHSLTPLPRRDVFDRVVSALIFTLLADLVNAPIRAMAIWLGNFVQLGTWTSTSDLLGASVGGVLVAAGVAVIVNRDLVFGRLRELKLTKRTAIPDQWFNAFAFYERYVVLNLKDGRRIMGWPREWPDRPETGHFILTDPCWLHGGVEIPLPDVEAILFAGVDVAEVEFLRNGDDPILTQKAETIKKSRAALIGLQFSETDSAKGVTDEQTNRRPGNEAGSS